MASYLFDTSALLAYFDDESGAEVVQTILDDPTAVKFASILSLFEFELRIHLKNLSFEIRQQSMADLRALLDEVLPVDETIRAEAIRLRTISISRIAAIDVLIAATASVNGAVLVHRDPHFNNLPDATLAMIMLPEK